MFGVIFFTIIIILVCLSGIKSSLQDSILSNNTHELHGIKYYYDSRHRTYVNGKQVIITLYDITDARTGDVLWSALEEKKAKLYEITHDSDDFKIRYNPRVSADFGIWDVKAGRFLAKIAAEYTIAGSKVEFKYYKYYWKDNETLAKLAKECGHPEYVARDAAYLSCDNRVEITKEEYFTLHKLSSVDGDIFIGRDFRKVDYL